MLNLNLYNSVLCQKLLDPIVVIYDTLGRGTSFPNLFSRKLWTRTLIDLHRFGACKFLQKEKEEREKLFPQVRNREGEGGRRKGEFWLA